MHALRPLPFQSAFQNLLVGKDLSLVKELDGWETFDIEARAQRAILGHVDLAHADGALELRSKLFPHRL